MMLKVLICDDESSICKLMNHLIDWDSLGLENCGFAYDGQEAYNAVKEKKPDIVITDIDMPVMTGLELIEKLSQEENTPSFILVSGYAEFEYARTAIRFGVSNFLLKPISQDELNDTLSKLAEKIKFTQNERKIQKRLYAYHTINRSKIRRQFLSDLLHGTLLARQLSIQSVNQEYGYHLQPAVFQIAAFQVDCLDFPEAAEELILNSTKRIQAQLKELCLDFEYIFHKKLLLLFLNYPASQTNPVYRAIRRYLDVLKDHLSIYGDIHVTLGVGLAVSSLLDLSYSLQTSRQALDCRFLLGTGRGFDAAKLDLSFTGLDAASQKQMREEIDRQLDLLHTEALDDLLCRQFSKSSPLLKQYPYVVPSVRSMWCQIFFDSLKSIAEPDRVLAWQQALAEQLEPTYTVEQVVSTLSSHMQNILRELNGTSDAANSKTIRIVKDYIAQNYEKHLELSDLASLVYLNSAYLGILFKNETGESFSHYLIRVRIDEAKRLLKDVQYNIAEISAMVGYKDTRYFSKLFKSVTGVTPKEYRRIHHTLAKGDD